MRNANKRIPISKDDRTFFNAFYEKYKNFMYHAARKYADIPQDCEDVVHDSLVRLMNNISTLRLLDHAETLKYIALTVKSVYLDNEKSRKTDDLLFLNDAEMEAIMVEQFYGYRSDQAITAKLAVHKLRQILPARDWTLLDAKYNLGLSQQEIGKLMNVSPDSVRMLLHRARKKAIKILDSETVYGGDKNGE